MESPESDNRRFELPEESSAAVFLMFSLSRVMAVIGVLISCTQLSR